MENEAIRFLTGQEFGSQKLLLDRSVALKYHYWTSYPS